ncbi:MAG: DinB family protein [Chloroflexi bacterium]|nr:DinB family protein [Chloroflexota bacterium]
MDATAFAALFAHHAWATDRLLAACEPLAEAQLAISPPGTYGPIGQTLKHLVEAEERYVAFLRGVAGPDAGGYGRPTPPEGLEQSIRVLRRRAAASNAALAELAASLGTDALVRGRFRGEDRTVRALTILVQALDHGAEHRTHVRAGLTMIGLEVPELDAWTWDEEALGPIAGGDVEA